MHVYTASIHTQPPASGFIASPSPFLGSSRQGGAQWRWMREGLSGSSCHCISDYIPKNKQFFFRYSLFGTAHSRLTHWCSLVTGWEAPLRPAAWALHTSHLHSWRLRLGLCETATTTLTSQSSCASSRSSYKRLSDIRQGIQWATVITSSLY